MRISDWSSDVCSSDLSEDVDPGRFTAIELAKARQAFAVLEAIPTTSRLGTALSLAIEATGQHRWHAGIVLHSAASETVLTSDRGKGLTNRLASSYAAPVSPGAGDHHPALASFRPSYACPPAPMPGRRALYPERPRLA